MKIIVIDNDNKKKEYPNNYNVIKASNYQEKNGKLIEILTNCRKNEIILILNSKCILTCKLEHIVDKFNMLKRDIVISINPTSVKHKLSDYNDSLNDSLIIGRAYVFFEFIKSTRVYNQNWIETIKKNNKFNVLYDIQYFLFYYSKDNNFREIESYGKTYVGKYGWAPSVISLQ